MSEGVGWVWGRRGRGGGTWLLRDGGGVGLGIRGRVVGQQERDDCMMQMLAQHHVELIEDHVWKCRW